MTTRIGFYGAGLMSTVHSAFLAASPHAHDIVAVHDPDRPRAEAFAARHGARAVSEAELLDLVDAVYITAWTAEHARLVRRAAAHGLAVMCEKPLAFDEATALQMIDDVEQADVVNQVGLLLRFVPLFVLARDLLRDPAAGRLLAVSFRDDQYIPNQGRYASTWRTDSALAGRGTLLEHSIHDLDILQWMCGDITTVSAATREVHGFRMIDDVAVVRLEFEDGGMAALTSVWHDVVERPSMRHVEIFCERLHVAIDDRSGGRLRWQYSGSDADELDADDAASACASSPGPATDVVRIAGSTLFNPASAFLGAIEQGGPSPLPLREALPAHRTVDAIYRSADANGVVITTEGMSSTPVP